MYKRERVESAESSDAWIAFQASRKSRRAGAKKAVETKTEKIKAEINGIHISLPNLNPSDLLQHAVDNRNACIPEWKWEKEDVEWADAKSIPLWPESHPARDRWCVNYLRHQATKYDAVLERISGRVAKSEAHRMLSKKIFDEIGRVFPYLKEEADRQYTAKWNE